MTPVPPDLPSGEDFRSKVVAFLDATVPRRGTRTHATGSGVAAAKAFQAHLAAAGLAGITWPLEYGGQGLPARFQRLFDREARAFQLPPRALEIGLGMCGPTILVHGTDAQKQTLIPPLLRGDHVWCELFSEPGAGSDLASVQTRARRDGDEWVVDGQKVWTSGAQHSDFAACLARTDPGRPKHEGITMLLVDMHLPGVTVAPLRQMTGDAQFNEVFLDGVRVPASSVLGEVHGGWRVARTMLAFERRALGAMGSGGGGGGGLSARRGGGHRARAHVRPHRPPAPGPGAGRPDGHAPPRRLAGGAGEGRHEPRRRGVAAQAGGRPSRAGHRRRRRRHRRAGRGGVGSGGSARRTMVDPDPRRPVGVHRGWYQRDRPQRDRRAGARVAPGCRGRRRCALQQLEGRHAAR